jgi:serine/threonine-protein kinase HipA
VIYSHNPAGKWTNQHQMSVNGKRDHFTKEDLLSVGESISLSRPADIVDEVIAVVDRWPEFAKDAGVKKEAVIDISKHHRIIL